MEIKVYLHRKKKKNFAVCEAFTVEVDLDKLPENVKNDIDYINQGFKNDAQKIAFQTNSVKKYGVGYLSFMRPQYEGSEEKNGNDRIYFDNDEMLFKFRREN